MMPLRHHLRTAFTMLVLPLCVQADSLILKDGKAVTGKTFRRDGDNILVTVEVPGPDGKMMNAERGTPVAEVDRVDCTIPAALKDAVPLLAQGNASGALAQIEPAVAAAEAFLDLPGSHWPDLAVLQAQALLAAGKDPSAELVAGKLAGCTDADAKAAGNAIAALIAARKGDFDRATSLANPLLPPGPKPSVAAMASAARALALLEKKQFDDALLGFLEAPVFAPHATGLSAISQLGAAKAYFGMEDFDRAIKTLEELTKAQPSSPEAKLAQTLLPEYQRRKRVVNEAKE